MMHHANESFPSIERGPALSQTAVGAVVAWLRVAERTNPVAAHRGALRALVADRFLKALADTYPELSATHASVIVAAAALGDPASLIAAPVEAEDETESSSDLGLIADTDFIRDIDGLEAVTEVLDSQAEHFDGSGQPSGLSLGKIPLGSRVCAVVHSLVGEPAEGFVPPWRFARRRLHPLSGANLDPDLVTALGNVALNAITAPSSPAFAVQELLTTLVQGGHQRGEITNTPPSTTAISNAVSMADNPLEVIELLAQAAREQVNATEVVVMTSSSTQLADAPVTRIADGSSPQLDLERLEDLFEFSIQAELRSGVAQRRSLSNGAEFINFADDVDIAIEEIVMPVMLGQEMWGLLIASRRPGMAPFEDEDSETLTSIATEISEAVASTARWAELQEMALGDQLTGIGNRHRLYRVLEEIFERPLAERIDSALIMCDVDGLKVVNDTMGHSAGDRLLIDAAAALQGAVRNPDTTTVCRIGGDEFCMVIDGGALLTAHDISDTIERLFERSAGSGPPRSISCGIAFADETVNSRSELLRTADENQYETKRARKESQQAETLSLTMADGETLDRRSHR